jgi:hypothetical protein
MGLHDNYGFALAAQPGESRRRPATNSNSRFIVQNGLPAHSAPGASIPDGRTIRRNRQDPSGISGAGIFIPVTNAIERLHEEFKRRIKTQTVLPSAETAAMLFWALLASGQIVMRKVDGWPTLSEKPSSHTIDLAA